MNEEFEGLGLVELLDLLEPVPEPEPISLWPQTAGWIWLGLALLALGVWLGRKWLLHHRANAYRRAALAEVTAANGDPARIAAILRRTALCAYPRAEVAGLTGPDWLAFLDRSYGGTGFSTGPGTLIADAPYCGTPATADVVALAADWIRKHAPEPAQ